MLICALKKEEEEEECYVHLLN